MYAFSENIRVAMIALQMNKLRAFLTMLGITIGVAAVIILISAGQGVSVFVTNQFSSVGSNLLVAFAQPDKNGKLTSLTMKDATALSDPLNTQDLSNIMPENLVNSVVVYEGKSTTSGIQGVTANYLSIMNRKIVNGRFFTQAELEGQERVAVVSKEIVDRLFDGVSPVGRNVRIGSVRFQIIGVLDSTSGGFGDGAILVPITTAQARLGVRRDVTGDYRISFILMQARDSDSVDAAIQQITRTLRQTREIKAGEKDTFMVVSQSSVISTLNSVIGLFTIFLGVVAGISLLVGGIGVMNIMLVTVTERTREIGLRKAVGAQNRDIVVQFLIEAMALSLFGGAIGVLIAAGLVSLIGAVATTFPISLQLSSIVLATVISASVGIFFGIYPAQRAAKLNPIDALRYE
ncbi:MAG: FtsX-like permease family protein [Anaerolineaceae bacterium]|nr:FtsX-like permease family protein [Anaerolineaceae bacterium]